MFSMEMSTRWRKELTWRSFMACAITILVIRLLNMVCIDHNMCSMLQWGSLIWFKARWLLSLPDLPAVMHVPAAFWSARPCF